MRGFFQYTLDLFDALAPADVASTAPETIAVVAHSAPSQASPGVSHKLVQPLSQAIVPATFTHPHANREVRLGDATVAYLFQRAKRRTIGFVVGPDGLVVRAPRWTPLGEVDAALREKSQWITRKLGESRERQARQHEARIDWCDGVVLPLFGDNIQVVLDPSHNFGAVGAQLDATTPDAAYRALRVGLCQAATPEQIRDAVQAWLMRQARAYFVQQLDHFAPLLQVQWRKLSLSNAGTRWGSAKSDGSIRLNWRLVHFRPAVIDYVVAHELSHLRVMDHSPRFWDTVRSVVPDYAALRGQLKDDAIPKW
ncbi:M48 family metallopeptidase [Rhodoferax sp. AJA081-3]|uniref:M48 family metallopeptidase n=1 Tax=Rhodoferax sp. AJA081-3 TaxID=2752316 RepID=UPI001ADFAD3A|nr:SprT family zinc-dependent metalloprotease [Rhodoferax sp. AJA081-3]QTN30215.1 M48 family metallopeptidase [Rhodoferax sp. AJA081-3]